MKRSNSLLAEYSKLVEHLSASSARAATLFRESLALQQRVGDKMAMARSLEGLAWVAHALGQPACAAQLFGAAHDVRQAIGAPLPPTDQPAQEQVLAAIRAILGEHASAVAWAAGQAMAPEQAMALALEEPAPP